MALPLSCISTRETPGEPLLSHATSPRFSPLVFCASNSSLPSRGRGLIVPPPPHPLQVSMTTRSFNNTFCNPLSPSARDYDGKNSPLATEFFSLEGGTRAELKGGRNRKFVSSVAGLGPAVSGGGLVWAEGSILSAGRPAASI